MKTIKTYLIISVFCTCITTHSGHIQRWTKGAKNFLQTLRRSVWNNEPKIQNADLTPKEQFNYRKRLETDIKEFKEGFNSKIGEPAKNLGSQITDNYNKLQANPKFQKVWNPITETWDQAKGQLNNPGGPDLSQLKNWIKNQSEPTRQRILAKLSQLKRAKPESEIEISEQHRQAIEGLENEGGTEKELTSKQKLPTEFDIHVYRKDVHARIDQRIKPSLSKLSFSESSNKAIQKIIDECESTIDGIQTEHKTKETVARIHVLDSLLNLFTSHHVNDNVVYVMKTSRDAKVALKGSNNASLSQQAEAASTVHTYVQEALSNFIKENENLVIKKIENIINTLPQDPAFLRYVDSLTSSSDTVSRQLKLTTGDYPAEHYFDSYFVYAKKGEPFEYLDENANLPRTWSKSQWETANLINRNISVIDGINLRNPDPKISQEVKIRINELLRHYEQEVTDYLRSGKDSIGNNF